MLARRRTQSAATTLTGLRSLGIGTIVLLVLLLATTALAVVLLHQRALLLGNRQSAATVANSQVIEVLVNAETGIRGYQLSGDASFLEPYERARRELPSSLATLRSEAGDAPAVAAAVDAEEQAARTWWDQAAAPVAAGDRSRTPAQERRAKNQFDRIRTANTEVADLLAEQNADEVARSDASTVAGIVLIGLVALVGGAVLLRPAVQLNRTLRPTMAALAETVQALGEGDLSARATHRGAPPEIRSVLRALNEMADSHQRTSSDLHEEGRLSRAVFEIGLALTTTLDVESVVRRSVQPIARHFGADITAVAAIDGEEDARRVVRATEPPNVPTTPESVELLLTVARRCWTTGGHYVMHGGTEDVLPEVPDSHRHLLQDAIARTGIRQAVVVPHGSGQRCFGYVVLARTRDEPWTRTEINAAIRLGREIGRETLHARMIERERALNLQLREVNTVKDDFVAMASHELRTPLAAITGNLELIRDGEFGGYDDAMRPAIAAMERNSRRLNRLVDNLLLLSRLEGKAAPVPSETVDLAQVCAHSLATQGPIAEHLRVDLVSDLAPGLAVAGTADDLERVLDNLIGNAMKFSAPGDQVLVRAFAAGDEVVVEVVDHGIGIDGDDLGRLFSRFFRAGSANRAAAPGTGLGLTISRLIAEQVGGRITVSSVIGEGSTFSLVLPAASTAPVATEPAAARHPV